MNYRLAQKTDIDRLVSMAESAKAYFRENGIDQWQKGEPNAACMLDSIGRQEIYVLEEDGEVSQVVESEYGYHLLIRKPIRDYVADAYLGELLLEAGDSARVAYSAAYESLDRRAYYAAYREHLEQAARALREEAENTGETETNLQE